MAFSDTATGGTTWLSYSVESTPGGSGTPGTPVTPNLFVPILDQGIKASWEQVKPEVMRGTRMTSAIMERARLKVGGPISYELNPSLGLEFLLAGFGASAAVTPVAAVQTTAINTTANGLTTLTVTGAFVPGAWVYINCSAGGVATSSTEPRQVVSYNAGTLVVGQCVTNATTALGSYIAQPAQTKYANSLLGSTHINQLPTLTVESDKSNWAWRFPGCYVDTIDIEFTKDQLKVTSGLMGSADPIPEGATIAYAPNAADEANAVRPLTSIDGLIIANGDPDATGTSALRAALGTTDLKISFKNALLQVAAFNLSHTYLVFPGDKSSCEISFNEISTSKRPDVYTDLIQASQATAFLAGGSKNYGTATTPDYGAVGFYTPTMKYSDADPIEKIGSVNTWAKKGMALTPAGGSQDYIQAFVLKPT